MSDNEYTDQRADWFGIPKQQDGESNQTYRDRVASAIRAKGHIIEAHEAQTNALYDDPNGGAMTGIMGAMAQALEGRNYGGDQIDNDIAAGVVAQAPKQSSEFAGLLALMLAMGDRK